MTASNAPRSVLVGLIGRGIGASRTPAMHEAAGRALGLPYVYRLLDIDSIGDPAPDLADIVRTAEWSGFTGLNVTYPYKQEILPLINQLSPAAAAVGAVNTVVFRDGVRWGDNTDVSGFRAAFQREMAGVNCDRVLQLGAGGAGAAVAHGLLAEGAGHLVVHDPVPGRAAALTARLTAAYGQGRASVTDDPVRSALGVSGLVNATPVGMEKLPGVPLDVRHLPQSAWVYDVIYFPLETALLHAARQRRMTARNGAGMAIWQAAYAFRLFTGQEADVSVMEQRFAAFDADGAL